jgi:hypothetical protein
LLRRDAARAHALARVRHHRRNAFLFYLFLILPGLDAALLFVELFSYLLGGVDIAAGRTAH